MALARLPNELLFRVAGYLREEEHHLYCSAERNMNSLLRANRRLWKFLNTYLYRYHIQLVTSGGYSYHPSALLWAANMVKSRQLDSY